MFLICFKITFYIILWSVSVCESSNDYLCGEDNCTDTECGTAASPEAVDVFVKMESDIKGTDLDVYDRDNELHNKDRSLVVYRCSDKNDLLVGNDIRQCDQGKWTGEVPRCAINLMNETYIQSMEIFDGRTKVKSSSIALRNKYNTLGAFTPPVAKQPDECLRWPALEQQLWVINLGNPVNVTYIRLKLFADNLQQLWNNREFVLSVFLNHIRGLSLRIECEFNPHPNHYNESDANHNNNNKFNKNYLILEYICNSDERHNLSDNKFNKILINFSYVRKVMKLMSISLCDLRVYYFEMSCGLPDYPVAVQVRRSVQYDYSGNKQQWEFNCNDNDHTLEGKTHLMCINGKWMDEFPICVPKTYCKELDFDKLDKNLIIEYEDTYPDEYGQLYVDSGKMARFSCRNSSVNRTEYRLNGISRVLCSNGKWHGLSSQIKPVCQLDITPLRKGIIRILLAVLLVCVIMIILLICLVVRSRRAVVRRKSLAEMQCTQNNDYGIDYENDYDLKLDDNKSQIYGEIPHIYYSCDDLDDSSYGMQNNSIYRDDMSDRFIEIDKTNSIYSNL